MERETYYVAIRDGEISNRKHDRSDYFEIRATQSEINTLRQKFNNMHEAGLDTYWRSHVPFVEYHNDSGNDEYDENMLEVYRILHELGNEQTREHIESMGILDDI